MIDPEYYDLVNDEIKLYAPIGAKFEIIVRDEIPWVDIMEELRHI